MDGCKLSATASSLGKEVLAPGRAEHAQRTYAAGDAQLRSDRE
jgi:hypothetical protein